MSERESTKRAIANPEGSDPELNEALTESEALKLQLVQEQHRHQLEMKKQDINHSKVSLGLIGRLIGDRRQAPMNLAFLGMAIGMTIVAGSFAAPGEYFPQVFGGGATLISGALGYVFGRGKK